MGKKRTLNDCPRNCTSGVRILANEALPPPSALKIHLYLYSRYIYFWTDLVEQWMQLISRIERVSSEERGIVDLLPECSMNKPPKQDQMYSLSPPSPTRHSTVSHVPIIKLNSIKKLKKKGIQFNDEMKWNFYVLTLI